MRNLKFVILVFAIFVGGCARSSAPVKSDTQPQAAAVAAPKDYLIHLPGIGGEMRIDRRLVQGLREGGYDGSITIYDWTRGNPGMPALLAYDANHDEAKIVAKQISDRLAGEPNARITITAHSGGTGIAAWALEDLPADDKIETLVLIAPALSPYYDLSNALKHVRGKVYVFSSLKDSLVLGTGTRMFGTIDGLKTDAAGRVGFTRPTSADVSQYQKLIEMPYRESWVEYGNYGEHIGAMSSRFAAEMITPLIVPVAYKPIRATQDQHVGQAGAR